MPADAYSGQFRLDAAPLQSRAKCRRIIDVLLSNWHAGLLFGSPSTACSRIAQPVANPARAPMAPAPAEELLRPLQAGVSVATQADSMTLEAESGEISLLISLPHILDACKQ